MATSGERIKTLRKALGLSADDLAERIGKDRATIFRYEKGDIENMPLSVIYDLSKVLHVSPGFLMGWERDNMPVSVKFRKAVSAELSIYDPADIQTAAEEGSDIPFLHKLIEGQSPVLLDDAYQAADELGTTVWELLGEENLPGITDEQAIEFARLFTQLDPEKRQVIVAAMQSFLSSQGSSPDAPK